jgi:hypothetical protein
MSQSFLARLGTIGIALSIWRDLEFDLPACGSIHFCHSRWKKESAPFSSVGSLAPGIFSRLLRREDVQED